MKARHVIEHELHRLPLLRRKNRLRVANEEHPVGLVGEGGEQGRFAHERIEAVRHEQAQAVEMGRALELKPERFEAGGVVGLQLNSQPRVRPSLSSR